MSIVVEGTEVLDNCGSVAKACLLLMGIIYAMNLSYPPKIKYTFEVFQKLLLELDVLKLSPKILSLRNKLIAWVHVWPKSCPFKDKVLKENNCLPICWCGYLSITFFTRFRDVIYISTCCTVLTLVLSGSRKEEGREKRRKGREVRSAFKFELNQVNQVKPEVIRWWVI